MGMNESKKKEYTEKIYKIANTVFGEKDLNKYIKYGNITRVLNDNKGKANIYLCEYDFKKLDREKYKELREQIKQIEEKVKNSLKIEVHIKTRMHSTDAAILPNYNILSENFNKHRRGILIIQFLMVDIKEQYEEIINKQKQQYNALLEKYNDLL